MANLPILLFDDSCGVCHWMVQFVLRHDHARRFAFAALGAAAGKRLALLWCAPAGAAPVAGRSIRRVRAPKRRPIPALWARVRPAETGGKGPVVVVLSDTVKKLNTFP